MQLSIQVCSASWCSAFIYFNVLSAIRTEKKIGIQDFF